MRIRAAHVALTAAPTGSNHQLWRSLQDEKQEMIKEPNAPRSQSSHFMFRKQEVMSREFFSNLLPQARGSRVIKSLNSVISWDSPPPKNTSLGEQTTHVSRAASEYFKHLAAKPSLNDENKRCEELLLQELRKWGVEDRTSDECGADVTIDDVHRVASHLPERKSPGPDRIPNEFYSTFAQPLAPLLAAVYNRSRKIGRMPKHMNDGLVTLLYKKGTRVDVRNYRPITLLNGDYKILTRILAKRSLKLVTQFVSEEQIGFVPNTFIAESAMFIQLMQAHLDTVDDGGVMMFLDMEKAFDRVSWRFLKRALVALRFTSQYTSWIDLLYSDKYAPSRRVYTNGKLSEPYQIHVGTAQGCPLSPLLFLPIMEAFTRLVKADKKLEGIRIGDTEYRIRHFADDTFGLLRNEHQIPRFSELIDVFCNGTNMRENESKREFVAIGNKSHLDPIYFPGRKEWCNEKGKVINVGWTEPGQFLISLGTPIGNKFDVMDFLKGRYGKAKSVLSNIKRVQSKSTNGKHKILNAHYYGRFRFYLWTLLFPSMLNQAIEQDARAFLWRRDPNLDPDLLQY